MRSGRARRAVLTLAAIAATALGLSGQATPTSATRSVPVSIVARGGPIPVDSPLSPMVPVAASTLAELWDKMRVAQAGRELVCAPTCWSRAVQPPNSLLLAVQYAVTTCGLLDHVAGHRPEPDLVYVDLRISSHCHSGGGGQSQRARVALLAIAKSWLPQAGVLTITVRGGYESAELVVIGTTQVSLN